MSLFSFSSAKFYERQDLFIKVLACIGLSVPVLAFMSLIFDMGFKAWGSFSFDFLWLDPERSGREGGIFPILVSTFCVVTLSVLVAFPLALGSALFLSDGRVYSGSVNSFRNLVSSAFDGLTAVPSIVFGLVGNQIFCRYFEFGYSILAGGLTLGLMIWPYMTRAFEETMAGVPKEVYLQSLSLGLSSYTYFRQIILSYCIPGMILGVVLALSRALAETSALLFTSGYSDRLPESLLDSGRVLSIHILDLSMNVTGGDQNAYRSGAALILFLLVIHVLVTASFRVYKKMVW